MDNAGLRFPIKICMEGCGLYFLQQPLLRSAKPIATARTHYNLTVIVAAKSTLRQAHGDGASGLLTMMQGHCQHDSRLRRTRVMLLTTITCIHLPSIPLAPILIIPGEPKHSQSQPRHANPQPDFRRSPAICFASGKPKSPQ